jgi:hypothetical protein
MRAQILRFPARAIRVAVLCGRFSRPLRDGPEPEVAPVIVLTISKPLFRTKRTTPNRSLETNPFRRAIP